MPGDHETWPPLLRGLIAMAQWHDPTEHEHDVLAFLDDATQRANALLVPGGTPVVDLVGALNVAHAPSATLTCRATHRGGRKQAHDVGAGAKRRLLPALRLCAEPWHAGEPGGLLRPAQQFPPRRRPAARRCGIAVRMKSVLTHINEGHRPLAVPLGYVQATRSACVCCTAPSQRVSACPSRLPVRCRARVVMRL